MAVNVLAHRSFRLSIGDIQFASEGVVRPLDFEFMVQRDKTITPNNIKLTIKGLAKDTRETISQLAGGDGVTVRLEVGYQENLGQIFFGVLRKAESWREGGVWLTQISGGDGEKAIRTAKISKTFKKGTKVSEVIRALVKALGVNEGTLNNTLTALEVSGYLSGGNAIQKALTVSGDAATALEDFMLSCGFEWSIQDGAFLAGPRGQAVVPGTGPLLTSRTGLVGTPNLDKDGNVVGKALMHADLIPGKVFRVESDRVTGNFIAKKTKHEGSSQGQEWYVSFVGTPPAPGSPAATLETT